MNLKSTNFTSLKPESKLLIEPRPSLWPKAAFRTTILDQMDSTWSVPTTLHQTQCLLRNSWAALPKPIHQSEVPARWNQCQQTVTLWLQDIKLCTVDVPRWTKLKLGTGYSTMDSLSTAWWMLPESRGFCWVEGIYFYSLLFFFIFL